MECRETGCHEAVHIKNIDLETLSRLDEHFNKSTLNTLIDLAIAVKSSLFRGYGVTSQVWRAGKVARQDIQASVNNDELKPHKKPA